MRGERSGGAGQARLIGWRLRRIREDRNKPLRVIAGLAGRSHATLQAGDPDQAVSVARNIHPEAIAVLLPPTRRDSEAWQELERMAFRAGVQA